MNVNWDLAVPSSSMACVLGSSTGVLYLCFRLGTLVLRAGENTSGFGHRIPEYVVEVDGFSGGMRGCDV